MREKVSEWGSILGYTIYCEGKKSCVAYRAYCNGIRFGSFDKEVEIEGGSCDAPRNYELLNQALADKILEYVKMYASVTESVEVVDRSGLDEFVDMLTQKSGLV